MEVRRFELVVDNDPRIANLNEEWFTCMGEAGVVGLTPPSPTLVQQMFDIMFPENGQYSSANRTEAELMALRDWERTAAVADWDCRQRLDYDTRRHAIDVELQQVFVDTHWADLEAWAQHTEMRREAAGL